MIIKRYIVNNMNEAMTRIRYELGNDAVIINQRKIRKAGIAGFFLKKVIEVTAAVENKETETKSEDLKSSIENITKLMKDEIDIKKEIKQGVKAETIEEQFVKEVKESPSEVNNSELKDSILDEMKEMKKMINSLKNTSNAKESSNENEDKFKSMLLNYDINEEIVEDILNGIEYEREEQEINEIIQGIVKSKIEISDEKLEGTVVLVGPTGVGKTTTIAKLAGKLALIEKKKVGLITIDTYRIGAVEQLRTYADIMNIPFKVVITTRDMEIAIESMKDCEVVLIDTTGRSSKNAMQISELRSFVDKANTTNIHLVISCTTKNKDINSIIEAYKVLGYNNVIITKLDETSTYGSILNILENTKKPLSFVTVGQNVPDDMEKVDAEKISKLILGEDNIC